MAIFDDGRIKFVRSPNDSKANLGDGSKLSNLFLRYTGKRFEEKASIAAPRFRLDRIGLGNRDGLGRRRR